MYYNDVKNPKNLDGHVGLSDEMNSYDVIPRTLSLKLAKVVQQFNKKVGTTERFLLSQSSVHRTTNKLSNIQALPNQIQS